MKEISTFVQKGRVTMKQLFVVVLLLCLSFQVACTKGPGATQAAKEERRLTDSELKNQIESRINSDEQLRAADLSINANADHNMATLSGTVDSEALRMRAIDMAKAVQPG